MHSRSASTESNELRFSGLRVGAWQRGNSSSAFDPSALRFAQFLFLRVAQRIVVAVGHLDQRSQARGQLRQSSSPPARASSSCPRPQPAYSCAPPSQAQADPAPEPRPSRATLASAARISGHTGRSPTGPNKPRPQLRSVFARRLPPALRGVVVVRAGVGHVAGVKRCGR